MRIKALAASAAVFMGLAIPATAGAQTLIGSGSIAAQPVLEALFAQYKQKTHGKVKFIYTANGGNAGVKDVQNGKSQFAGNARPPLPSDAGTTYIKLYLDGLCIDTNRSNKVSNIDLSKLSDIYTGVVTNWNQVPGSNKTTTIDPYGRDTNGGTYNFFLQSVLNNQPNSSNVNALTADGLVKNAVKQDPDGIGYFGLAYQDKSVNTLKVNGIPCVPSKIKNLKYPLSRYIYMVVPSSGASPAVLKFADWVRRDATAGKVIARAGGVPAFNKKH